jgi:Tol biopolymer transport system component
LLSAALAAVTALVLAACGGSPDPRPDLLLVSTRDGDYAIFALNADGSRQKRLTDADVDATTASGVFFQTDPAWSPDARRIAFASRRSGSFDIYVMNADGTGSRRLTATKEDDAQPSWSPDQRQIVFARGAPTKLFVMDADGSNARRLTDDDAEEADPAWSPDGTWIVYVRRAPGTPARELWLVRPDGSGRRQLTSFARSVYNPAWSPDSTRIAFAGGLERATLDIYTVGVGGKGLSRRTQSTEDAFEPSWSPDGKTIAFARNGAIQTIDAEGSVEEITDPDDNDTSPVWNPKPPADDES